MRLGLDGEHHADEILQSVPQPGIRDVVEHSSARRLRDDDAAVAQAGEVVGDALLADAELVDEVGGVLGAV